MYDNEEVLKKYDRAIHKVAHKYFTYNTRFSYDDLVAQGQMAALKANKLYDDTKNASFFTYLTRAVDREVMKYVGDNIFEVSVTEHQQRQEFEKSGNLDKLHDKAGVGAVRFEDSTSSPDSVRDPEPWSANSIVCSGVPSPEEKMLKDEAISVMIEELDCLPDKIKNVIELRWFEGKTLQEIADNLNVSKQTIHGWEKKGFQKLQRRVMSRLGS